MAGLDFSLFHAFECPVSGNPVALPRSIPQHRRATNAIIAAPATGGSVRIAVIETIVGLRLLSPQAAIHANRGEWLVRARSGSFELSISRLQTKTILENPLSEAPLQVAG